MILDEQIYGKGRAYYRGERVGYDESKALFKGWTYLTTQPCYAGQAIKEMKMQR